jgi:uncharacterized membrane protein YeiH
MLYLLDLFGVAVFAITGALVAREKQLDLFGVIVIALVTAVGGGTLRDVIIGSRPVFWVADPTYVIVAIAAGLGTMVFTRIYAPPYQLLLTADAFGLAIFTLLGTETALKHDLPTLIVVMMGVISSVAGGIIRDLLSNRTPIILHSELYATASFCGAVVFIVLAPASVPAASLLTVCTTLLLRLAAIHWHWRLPTFV